MNSVSLAALFVLAAAAAAAGSPAPAPPEREAPMTSPADWSKGFHEAAALDAGGRAVDVFLENGRLYAAVEAGKDVLLKVFDASDPRAPREIGKEVLGPGSLVKEKFVEGSLFVRGGIAGVAQNTPDLLRLADVSDPANPRPAGSFPTKGDATEVWITEENVAYVPAWSGVCHVVDVRDPANPKEVSEIPPPDGTFGDGEVGPEKYGSGIAVEGKTAYAVWWVHGRLVTLDVSDPKSAAKIGEFETPPDRQGWAYRVLVSRGRAYLSTDQYSKRVGGIVAVDVSDPARLRRLGYFSADGYGEDKRKMTRGLALDGNHLFFTDYNYGVACLDVQEPSAMRLVGQQPLADARGICAGAGVVYVAAGPKIHVLAPGAESAPAAGESK